MAIHPTAIIDKQAELAGSVEVGPYVVIDGPVKIGQNVRIYPNAYLSGWTEIGEGCEIHPNAIVGHLPQDFHFEGGRSYCKIGANTIIREGASIHRGTQAESCTTIGERCFILGYAHVGHNCVIGDGVKIYNAASLAGHVTVGDNTIISAYCLVHQFCRIGEYVMVGAGTRLLKDVPPYMKVLHESLCVGYNAYGLRRSGAYSQDEINEVRDAYRIIFRSPRPLRKALEDFSKVARETTGLCIVEFLRSETKLGFIGGRKAHASTRDARQSERASEIPG